MQSAHWHHPQATLFTAHAWINNDNNFSMVIISDDLNHTKYCIFVFIDEEYPGEVTSIEDSDIDVSVMHKSVNAWKWPRSEDKIFYPATQIV